MINRTEQEIINNWQGNFHHTKVSIVCLAYNHEKFIERALDGFLMQNTSFPFEIVIHDDASIDGTTTIIKKYESKYPKILSPIYEETNIFSKHDGSIRTIIANKIRGEYIAICEGDDCWLDCNKLQIQYDTMKNHQDCILCVHNTVIHDLSKKKRDSLFNKWNEQKELSDIDVFTGWNVHTSSFFMKSFLYKKIIEFPNSKEYYFGDFMMLSLALYYGKIIYIPKIMSLYNINNKTGLTYINNHINSQTLVNRELLKIQFIENYNKYTSNRFINITKDLISYYKLLCKLYENEPKEIIRNGQYKNAFKNLPKSLKFRIYLNAYFPKLFIFLKCVKNRF